MQSIGDDLAALLAARFPRNDVAPGHFGELLSDYAASGLSPPHLLAELKTGDDGKFWSAVWEAMLYRHLKSCGFKLRNQIASSGQIGPDFAFDHDGRTIWIEAIVPSPEGIPADWLDPSRKGVVKSKPHEQMLLRATSAIADKRKKFDDYRSKGIVGAHDCTVIAVNICRLSDYDIRGIGVSRFPLSMEAVLPIGPLMVPIRNGEIDGPAQNAPRFSIKKPNGAEIHTDGFFDPQFSGVSAIMQAHQNHMVEKKLGLAIVHNPKARAQMPTSLFGAYREFVGEEQADGSYTFTDGVIQ